MKIYTKTGDKGFTSLIGGKRVPKYHKRIEAYGTVDELISYIGLVKDLAISIERQDDLLAIQDKLMICASILAADCEDCGAKTPSIYDKDIQFLEKRIDEMDSKLESLNSFILPGGHATVSFTHISRTICRRAERRVVELSESAFVPELLNIYLNRLSDYLFVLSRYFLKELNVQEIKWLPKVE